MFDIIVDIILYWLVAMKLDIIVDIKVDMIIDIIEVYYKI